MNDFNDEYKPFVVFMFLILPALYAIIGLCIVQDVTITGIICSTLLQFTVTTLYLYVCSKVKCLDMTEWCGLLINTTLSVCLIAALSSMQIHRYIKCMLCGISNSVCMYWISRIVVCLIDFCMYISRKVHKNNTE